MDLNSKVKDWFANKPNLPIKWTLQYDNDTNSAIILAEFKIVFDGIKDFNLKCKCVTENKEDSIRSAVEAIVDEFINKISNIFNII